MRRRRFVEYVGIDYSGAGAPDAGRSGLRVYWGAPGVPAAEVFPSPSPRPSPPLRGGEGGRGDAVARGRRWSRRALAEWLLARLREPGAVVVGLDHCFSLPKPLLDGRGLGTWDAFLDDFCRRWPTDRRTVASCRPAHPYADEVERFRLCERWTSSAKSVYQFGMNGQVATSSHAGIPWLRWLRVRLGPAVHFWPFDGWTPPAGAHVVAEVYPSIFRNRFPRDGRSVDRQDAFAVAEWLRTRDALGTLGDYLSPRLADEERRVAAVEGWILGVA